MYHITNSSVNAHTQNCFRLHIVHLERGRNNREIKGGSVFF